MRQSLFILFIIFYTATSVAQTPYSIHLNQNNGLPSNAVYDVLQDSRGFIWLASNDGLTRYDGFEYKTYKSDEQTSFPGSCIKEDKFGRIWYENFDGFLYYVQHDSLVAFNNKATVGFIPFVITSTHLFLMQIDGVECYNLISLKKEKFIPVKLANSLHCSELNDQFYFIDDGTLFTINAQLELKSNLIFKDDAKITYQLYPALNELIVVSKLNDFKQLYRINSSLQLVDSVNISAVQLIQGIDFLDNNYWIHTPTGSYVYGKETGKLSTTYFSETTISNVLKDRQDNYWFTSPAEGIFLVPNITNQLFSLKNYSANRISATANGYVVGTKKGELISISADLKQTKLAHKSLENAEIYYLFNDSIQKTFYYSSKGFTTLKNNLQTEETNNLAIKEMCSIDEKYYAIASSGFCGLMLKPNYNKAITSSWDSIFKKNINPNSKNVAPFLESIRGKSVSYNTSTQTIYTATNVGLFKQNSIGIEEIKHKGNSFLASKVICFNNQLFTKSNKGNLYRIINDTDFELLNERLGFNDFDIKFLKEFENKLVIVGSNAIQILDMNNLTAFKVNLNVISNEIRDVLLNQNNLLVLTFNGILTIDINQKLEQKQTPVFIVNWLEVNECFYSTNNLPKLNYNQNSISINFSLLDFGSNEAEQVWYKINDGDWIPISNETRTLAFPSLAPDNYIIQFKHGNEICSESIQFEILPPFWKRWWFLLLSFLVIAASAYAYYKYQISLLFKQVKLLREKVQLEQNLSKSILKSIKSQMNPHFFYNALNTIQAYIFTNDKEKANNYLAKFSKLTRLILEQSEKETISLAEEIDALTLYLELEKMRFVDGFEYTIELKNCSNKENIEFPPMIIQPYVENAVKHGLLHKEQDRKLSIVFEENKHHLIVTIEDNGIGRKRSEELNKIKKEKYQSFSSQANEKRLEILNKGKLNKVGVDIIDKMNTDESSLGTKVILSIPIN